MAEWKEYKLGEIADITSSKRIFYSEYVPFGVPFYRSKEVIDRFNKREVQTELFISEARFTSIKEKFGVPQKDDILLTSVGTLGVPFLVDENERFYFKDGNLTWLRKLDKGKVDALYLFIWLQSKIGQQKLEEITIGSTQPALTISGLKTVEILLPPLPEQQAIAEVLSSLDAKIDLLHRQNKTLEALAETLFRQWFVEEAEESREIGTVKDLIEFNPKLSLSKGTLAPYLEMSNVSNEVYHPLDWYSREFASGTKFQNGDTLLARITPCLENGKTAFVDFLEDEEVGWGSTEFVVMRSKKPLHSFFSYLLARNNDFRNFAIGSMIGSSGRQRADIVNIMSYEIQIPPLEVMNRFNEYIEPSLGKMKINNDQIRKLTKLRDELLPKLMSGEVRVER